MDCVVAPFDHVLPVVLDEVNVTDPPAQNVVAPLFVIVGVEGTVLIVTLVLGEVETHNPFVIVTV